MNSNGQDLARVYIKQAPCLKYFSVSTDSCDCGGINDKHGGHGVEQLPLVEDPPAMELITVFCGG